MPGLVRYQDEGQPKALLEDIFLNMNVSKETLLLRVLLASILFFSQIFLVYDGGVTFNYNSILKKTEEQKQNKATRAIFLIREKIHGNTTSFNISICFSTGNTLHYHPDDCLESCNMDFNSFLLTKLQLIWHYFLEPGFNHYSLINIYFRVFSSHDRCFSLIARPFQMYLHNPMNCTDQ